MNLNRSIMRARGKARRFLATNFAKRLVRIDAGQPIISFTFDDAPKTAFWAGRNILMPYGVRPTYYVSFGLLDQETEVGRIGSRDDLALALSEGCELGCHTFDHVDAWHTPLNEYLASVRRNEQALGQIFPQTRFSSFAYPKSGPTLGAKLALAKRFSCCRGAGQTANAGMADLGLLNSVFLDQRTHIDLDFLRREIDSTARQNGWLIFATHDVAVAPSPYGCSPEFLECVAKYAQESGALLLPVGEAHALLFRQIS